MIQICVFFFGGEGQVSQKLQTQQARGRAFRMGVTGQQHHLWVGGGTIPCRHKTSVLHNFISLYIELRLCVCMLDSW
jgi:hypothetical protein